MRVLTYNIRGGLGTNNRRDTAVIAQTVGAQAPDIVCFQEVHQRLPWSGWINQPKQLGQALGLRFVFQKCFGWFAGGYGLGIAARGPITRVVRHRLPGHGEPRGALQVELAWNKQTATVVCTHWGLNRNERAAQAIRLADIVRGLPPPILVCGDINDTPDADYVQSFLQSSGLCDAGAPMNLPTYPADTPRARIDVVFCSADLRIQHTAVVPTLASDHLPFIVDLS